MMKLVHSDRQNLDPLQTIWAQNERKLPPSHHIHLSALTDMMMQKDDDDTLYADDESVDAYPKSCNAGSHFREVVSSSYRENMNQLSPSNKKDTSQSMFRLFTTCSSNNINDLKELVGRAYKEVMSVQCGLDPDDYDNLTIPHSLDTFDQEEDYRLRRLGSWNTLGTVNTLHTSGTHEMSAMQQLDDDGHPIDPKILQVTQENVRTKTTRQSRQVKFDYPPVSSMRQCPRADREDLPELFFTEEELEDYEADRECTRRTDDIEIVAISQSLSDLDQPREEGKTDEAYPAPHLSPRSTECTSPRACFGSYVPTPKILNNRRRRESGPFPTSPISERESDGPEKRSSWGKSAKPTPESPSVLATGRSRSPLPSPPATQGSPRLVKSVQIFLRERSTGK